MQTSSMTTKGQITIPQELRKQLGLHPGDKVGFILEADHLVIFRKENDIEAAFGICKPKHSVSLKEMEAVVRKRGSDAGS